MQNRNGEGQREVKMKRKYEKFLNPLSAYLVQKIFEMKNLEPSIKISVFFEAVLEECRVKISFFYQKLIAHL